MKKCIAILLLITAISSARAQIHEYTIGVNRNHFYDFQRSAEQFQTTDRYGYAVGWSFSDRLRKKFPYRVTVQQERQSGKVKIFNGGLGGGVSLDADIVRHVIAVHLYPLNFHIKQRLECNVGVALNVLMFEHATGSYQYRQGGSPPVGSTKDLEDDFGKISSAFGAGMNARIAYAIPMPKGWFLIPQFQLFVGFSDEIRVVSSRTKSLRHYLGIGFARKI